MPSDQVLLSGIELSSGRRPVIFAALDGDLNVVTLQKWDTSEALTSLEEYENIWLVISLPSLKREQVAYTGFKKKLVQAGFKSYSNQSSARQFFETNAQDCFHTLSGHKLLPRRTLEGRLQRSAVLYEQGLQITDPVDIIEEITRYKLIQGILPLENIYSSQELDALVAAYLAWMAFNRPGQIVVKGEFVLPAQE
jgi:hypothetical protein